VDSATDSNPQSPGLVLLTGASGYVGSNLLPRLVADGVPVRCMARKPEQLAETAQKLSQGRFYPVEVVSGDVMDRESLSGPLTGVDTAYYLVHRMAASGDFERQDRQAAENFVAAAQAAGVRRIVYLGGLGDENDPNLSPHLRSRHEVGKIFRRSPIETIEFRASVVIGQGSLSFDLIRSLTKRLPVMICPKWLSTPTQPIAIADMVEYLAQARTLPLPDGPAGKSPEAKSRVYEIGGEDVITYGGLIEEYARQKGLRRLLIPVPVLTPYLSSLWLGLVTPASAEVGRHLIEGLKNPTTVSNPTAKTDFPIQPLGIREAIAKAVAGGA